MESLLLPIDVEYARDAILARCEEETRTGGARERQTETNQGQPPDTRTAKQREGQL